MLEALRARYVYLLVYNSVIFRWSDELPQLKCAEYDFPVIYPMR